jgi:hypothetical protein
VSTAACIRLGLRLIESGGGPSELHVVDAVGHALPDEWREVGARYLLRLCG